MNAVQWLIRLLYCSAVLACLFFFLKLPVIVDRFMTRKSINVLAWPTVIDAQYFQEFEQKTGIKVYLTYFDSYEELVIKLRAGGGDYDLVMAADYVVNILKEEKLIKKIDHTKIKFWHNLYKPLLGLYYDPTNDYTLPFAWEIYGIGIGGDYFNEKRPPATWGLLFDPVLAPDRVGMLDDAREVVSIAALYLFGKKDVVSPADLVQIKELLLAQKKRVAMYTDLRTDYLLVSGTVPLALGISSTVYQAMRKYKNIHFIVPKEGSFIVIDTLVLPQTTHKEAFVYEFLNYLYQPDILKKYADRYNFFPALKGVMSDENRFFLTPTHTLFSSLRFFTYKFSDQQLRDVWISLKA
jgi:spermidine/putrescine transport system substrate-binding protein